MKQIKRYLLALVILFTGHEISHAQLSVGSGAFISHETSGNRLVIRTENSWLRITPYNDNIVRVQISRENTFDDFSYALVTEPEDVAFEVKETGELLNVTLPELIVDVRKEPFGLIFKDKKGNILNEDDPGSGIRFHEAGSFVYKRTFEGEKFIGLGEKTGPFNKAGRAYTNWNTDAPSYGIYADPLYITIPFYMGIHDSLVYGIYLDNTYRTDFSFGADPKNPGFFACHDGQMDYFFISGEKVADIVTSYTGLTGRMEMPPLWSLGLHQSRWSYYPDTEVMNIARTFREKKIPADVMTLDIHYMDEYKIFSWHKNYFPDPEKLISDLREMGFRTTLILDPGIKIEEGYDAYETGLEQDVYVKSPGGDSYYRARVWPGWCHFPDFTKPDARNWWGKNTGKLAEMGIRGFWNDMNEPADWSKMFDPLSESYYEGNPSTHFRSHNVYGMQMARASYEGAKEAMNERPFVLTRAGFAGVQRYSAVWTGDNVSSDQHMMLGVRLLNNVGISGIPFCGMDIPGFSGGKELDNELYARFISIGAFTPFFRIHAAKNTRAQEPWTFGEWVEDVSKKYIELRYQLLPYLYSSFYESTQNGLPVQKSLSLDYSFDPFVYDQLYENQYFFGPSILVAPVSASQDYARIYLPENGFYDFHTDQFYPQKGEYVVESSNTRAGSKLPLFVKAGSIIPMQKVIQSATEDPGDTLSLHVYKGDGNSTFIYYEDDGITYEYENGSFYKRTFEFKGKDHEIIFGNTEGSYTSTFKYFSLVFHGFEGLPKTFKVNGRKTELTFDKPHPELTIENNPSKITIKWN